MYHDWTRGDSRAETSPRSHTIETMLTPAEAVVICVLLMFVWWARHNNIAKLFEVPVPRAPAPPAPVPRKPRGWLEPPAVAPRKRR